MKDASDRTTHLVGQLDSLSLLDRLSVMRNTAASLSPQDQLRKSREYVCIGSAGWRANKSQPVFVKDLLAFMPSWAKQEASAHLNSLMFFDPVAYLPYELVSIIFSHLSPSDLLNASGVNRAWREHTQDEELWRSIFSREGWHMDIPKLRDFERKSRERARRSAGGAPTSTSSRLQRRDSRKRRAGEAFSEGEASAHPADANGAPSADSSAEESGDEHMDGVERAGDADGMGALGKTKASTGYARSTLRSRRSSTDSAMSTDSAFHSGKTDFKMGPTLLQQQGPTRDAARDPRVSWAYLYKQRRLLEKNWDDGKYEMFRLPHAQYPEEGHDECVYTIQHTGEWLVSGSRDKTIRIWDLTTSRLRQGHQAILRGHTASVLCLQFDASPENDIVVSGGSDSWVIIWRFSTGEMIKKLDNAHSESVLNLRFDHRYIVTCSKDKTIKIWNRHTITNTSPIIPAYVVHHFDDPMQGTNLIQEHTLLTTLTGHGAAVNAVMIHKDTIVSASGDRTIRAWNIQTGKCEKNYLGHTKGIACVQYDGRRIISGSSDNTVRIFDAERQVEVACLTGHSNLVRTVQARFGDLETVTDEELYNESQRADHEFYSALDDGMQPATVSRQQSRNAGSSRPEHMLSTGAKIPPGGGGSKWAKIVSGSYDETIIVWKKDKDGKWVHRHRLHQDSLLRNSRPTRHRRDPAAPAAGLPPLPVNHHITLQNVGPQQHLLQNSIAQQALAQTNGTAPHSATLQQSQQLQADLHSLQSANAQRILQGAPSQVPALNAQMQAQAHASTSTQPVQPPPPSAHPPTLQPAHGHVQAHGLAHAQAHAQAHAHAHHAPVNHRESSNRVFKLQFDARRIVCCSQNRIIVGWDFANGDADLKRVGSWSLETC
jgi:F-box and WD-40 domain protein 1/11